jgi:hypothetical protein
MAASPTYYLLETSQNYFAAKCPLIRDAAGKPMVLTEEIAVGSASSDTPAYRPVVSPSSWCPREQKPPCAKANTTH